MDLYREEQGEYPVLLLDDVFSELDKTRSKRLAKAISGYQTIITCTHLSEEIEESLGQYKEFSVSGGIVTEKQK